MNENKANYAKIGFFVLSGVALIVVAIAIAGARTFNKKVILAETYFGESVTGLDIGSPVKYRGVPVGEVKEIGFVYSEYGNAAGEALTQNMAQQILVVMALNPGSFGLLDAGAPEKVLKQLVDQGLRVKVASAGVTGLAFLELDYFTQESAQPLPAKMSWKPNHPFIPSSASTMTTLKKAMDDVFVKLSSIDLQALGDELLITLYLLQNLLANTDVGTLTEEATALMVELRSSNASVKRWLDSPEFIGLPNTCEETVLSAKHAITNVVAEITPLTRSLHDLSRTANHLVEQTSCVVSNNSGQITQTLAALKQTAQTLNRTTGSQQEDLITLLQTSRRTVERLEQAINELRANPAALLFSPPPQPLPETHHP